MALRPWAFVALASGALVLLLWLTVTKRSIAGEGERLAAFVAMPGPSDASVLDFPKFRAEPGQMEVVVERDAATVFDYKVVRFRDEADQRILRIPCAVAAVAATCPATSISRRGMLTAPVAAPGLPEISFESDAFNEGMRVQCTDPRFAYALVDQKMMEWLLLFPPGCGIQLSGGQVLAFGRESPRAMQTGPVIELLNDFLGHVPPSLGSLYPPGV